MTQREGNSQTYSRLGSRVKASWRHRSGRTWDFEFGGTCVRRGWSSKTRAQRSHLLNIGPRSLAGDKRLAIRANRAHCGSAAGAWTRYRPTTAARRASARCVIARSASRSRLTRRSCRSCGSWRMCITRAGQHSGSSPARFSSWMTMWARTRHSRICTVSGRPLSSRSCRVLAIRTRIARIFGRWRSGRPEPSALRHRLAGWVEICHVGQGSMPLSVRRRKVAAQSLASVAAYRLRSGAELPSRFKEESGEPPHNPRGEKGISLRAIQQKGLSARRIELASVRRSLGSRARHCPMTVARGCGTSGRRVRIGTGCSSRSMRIRSPPPAGSS